MKLTLGVILTTIPFLFLLMIFLEGGMFGILMYVLYLFAASCSAGSLVAGLLLIKHRNYK